MEINIVFKPLVTYCKRLHQALKQILHSTGIYEFIVCNILIVMQINLTYPTYTLRNVYEYYVFGLCIWITEFEFLN